MPATVLVAVNIVITFLAMIHEMVVTTQLRREADSVVRGHAGSRARARVGTVIQRSRSKDV